jgi:hypothetical protein
MKKSYVGILGIALVLVGFSALNVNANTTYNYDVNGDGNVDVIDIMDLKKYILLKAKIAQLEPTVTTTTVTESQKLTLSEDDCKQIVDNYIFENCPSLWAVITDMSVEYKTNGIVVNVSLSRTVLNSESSFVHDAWFYDHNYLTVVLDNDGNVISVS